MDTYSVTSNDKYVITVTRENKKIVIILYDLLNKRLYKSLNLYNELIIEFNLNLKNVLFCSFSKINEFNFDIIKKDNIILKLFNKNNIILLDLFLVNNNDKILINYKIKDMENKIKILRNNINEIEKQILQIKFNIQFN